MGKKIDAETAPETPPPDRLHIRGVTIAIFALFVIFIGLAAAGLTVTITDVRRPIEQRAYATINENRASLSAADAVMLTLEADAFHLRNERHQRGLSTVFLFRSATIFLGAVLVLTGSIFILGQISGTATTAEAGGRGFTASISTSSPGLFAIFVGALLAGSVLFAPTSLQVSDDALFVGRAGYAPAQAPPPTTARLEETNCPENPYRDEC